jgi:hypothetical protein
MMKTLLTGAVSIGCMLILLSCSLSGGYPGARVDQSPSIENLDLEVWGAALRPLLPSGGDEYVVIVDQTTAPALEPEVLHDDAGLSLSTPELLSSYRDRNSRDHVLPELKKIERVRKISAETVENIFSRGVFTGWERFGNEYRGARALVRISFPGYSLDRRGAIVYISSYRGSLAGEEKVVLLQQRDGVWSIKWSRLLLQS